MEEQQQTGNGKTIMKRIILPIFIIIIAIELFVGIKTLRRPLVAVDRGLSIAPLQSGKIALVAGKTSFKVGENADVTVRVSTGGHSVDGTDLYLKYDPTFLQVDGSTSFAKGSIYPDYPVISVDSSTGIIRVSGIASSSQGAFNGAGDLGTLRFKALKVGNTTLRVQYDATSTTFSNIIETSTAKNLLSSSSGLDLAITDTNTTAIPSQSCSVRVYSSCKDGQGRIGSYWCTSINDPLSCSVGCFKELTGDDRGCKVISN